MASCVGVIETCSASSAVISNKMGGDSCGGMMSLDGGRRSHEGSTGAGNICMADIEACTSDLDLRPTPHFLQKLSSGIKTLGQLGQDSALDQTKSSAMSPNAMIGGKSV